MENISENNLSSPQSNQQQNSQVASQSSPQKNTESANNNSGPIKPKSSAGGMILGNVFMLIAAIFWGVNVTVTKALIPEWMSSQGIVIVRMVGGCILFWIVSLFMRQQKIEKSDWWRILLGGFVGLFGFIFLFVTSLKYASPIDVSIIMTLPPMFVILIGVLFLGRRPSVMEYIGVAISFAGAVIVILGGASGAKGSDNLLGDILAIISTICYAFYLVILEKPTQKYRPVMLLRWIFLFAAIPALCLIPSSLHQPILSTTDAAPWIEIIFILVGPTFLAYFLVQPAIKFIGSELVSLYQYLLPVFAAVSAVIMKVEVLRGVQILAMATIIVGMLLTNYYKFKKTKKLSR